MTDALETIAQELLDAHDALDVVCGSAKSDGIFNRLRAELANRTPEMNKLASEVDALLRLRAERDAIEDRAQAISQQCSRSNPMLEERRIIEGEREDNRDAKRAIWERIVALRSISVDGDAA
jgi:hypothetical protein